MNNKQLNFAIEFHTALRKATCSYPTSVVWNVIYLLRDDKEIEWENFISETYKNLGEGYTLKEACYMGADSLPYNHTEVNIFRAGIRCIEDGDWEAIEQFIFPNKDKNEIIY
jgi:hypothetical protein